MAQAVSIFDIITQSVKAKEEVAVKRGLAGRCEERKSDCQKWEDICECMLAHYYSMQAEGRQWWGL